jgi:hypothetical protein
MSNHTKHKCKHGTIVKQCRCPGGNWIIVDCPDSCKKDVVSENIKPDYVFWMHKAMEEAREMIYELSLTGCDLAPYSMCMENPMCLHCKAFWWIRNYG